MKMSEAFAVVEVAGIDIKVDYDKVFISPWLPDAAAEERHVKLMRQIDKWARGPDKTKDRVKLEKLIHLRQIGFYPFGIADLLHLGKLDLSDVSLRHLGGARQEGRGGEGARRICQPALASFARIVRRIVGRRSVLRLWSASKKWTSFILPSKWTHFRPSSAPTRPDSCTRKCYPSKRGHPIHIAHGINITALIRTSSVVLFLPLSALPALLAILALAIKWLAPLFFSCLLSNLSFASSLYCRPHPAQNNGPLGLRTKTDPYNERLPSSSSCRLQLREHKERLVRAPVGL